MRGLVNDIRTVRLDGPNGRAKPIWELYGAHLAYVVERHGGAADNSPPHVRRRSWRDEPPRILRLHAGSDAARRRDAPHAVVEGLVANESLFLRGSGVTGPRWVRHVWIWH